MQRIFIKETAPPKKMSIMNKQLKNLHQQTLFQQRSHKPEPIIQNIGFQGVFSEASNHIRRKIPKERRSQRNMKITFRSNFFTEDDELNYFTKNLEIHFLK